MNNLTHVKTILDDLFIALTVKQMTNPENKKFYLGTHTLADCKEMLHDADEGLTDAYWTAFGIAQGNYLEQAHIEKEHLEYDEHCCPECGCASYVEGCVCPNCDYIED